MRTPHNTQHWPQRPVQRTQAAGSPSSQPGHHPSLATGLYSTAWPQVWVLGVVKDTQTQSDAGLALPYRQSEVVSPVKVNQ